MEFLFDLHVHSSASDDGCMEIEKIINTARAKGLSGVAVCDHGKALKKQIDREDFLVIPALELATEYGHLLGLFVTEDIAHESFEDAVIKIKEQGGIAVLAHPFQKNCAEEKIEKISHLLCGVEVFNSRASYKYSDANKKAYAFAKRRGLLFFAGSDAHTEYEIGNACVALEAESLNSEDIKKALLQKENRFCGQSSKRIYIAKSQLIKLKKKKAGAVAYIKWSIFYIKCALLDLFVKGESVCL